MKLEFFEVAQLDRNLKATVHKTGKLGFTVEAAKKLELNEQKSARFARNSEGDDDSLYVVVLPGIVEGAFKINKAGAYYYINTKPLFDTLKWDYVRKSISFDITEEEYDGQKIFKLRKKEKDKRTIKE